jgi:apolipoprotein D and lipocalin family protein
MRRQRPHRLSALVAAWIVGVAALALVSGTASAQADLPTVDKVDMIRYAGLWFEIARLPNKLQAECAGDVTTSFTRRGMRTFDVETRCRRADGSDETDMGIARVQDLNTGAKMEIRFLPLALAWLPFAWSDYWIIDLAPDYGHAMVGVPARDALWILARRPEMDARQLERLIAKAQALGFDTTKLVRTRHSAP